MNKNTIIVVFSCQKNKYRHELYRNYLKGLNYIIVEGGHSVDKLNDKLLTLNVEDDYESLPTKVLKAYTFLYNKYKKLNILKIDDDSYVNVRKLQKIKFNFDYGGLIYSDYYKNIKYKFAFGGGYYLSNKALTLLIKNFNIDKELQEDKAVGYTLMPFLNKLKVCNSGVHLDNKNILFTSLFESIFHPVDIKTIAQLAATKTKNFFYKKP